MKKGNKYGDIYCPDFLQKMILNILGSLLRNNKTFSLNVCITNHNIISKISFSGYQEENNSYYKIVCENLILLTFVHSMSSKSLEFLVSIFVLSTGNVSTCDLLGNRL